MTTFEVDTRVSHRTHGIGTVRTDLGETIIVRFEHGVEELLKADVEPLAEASERLARSTWDTPLEVIHRAQAEAIASVNNAWGVFGRSRIKLLPHQLWVCREVTREWPTRWLVADDVGLGKTVEAGLILTSLLGRGRVRRLLVMCPASLVSQWQHRLRTMFDIRLAIYNPLVDTEKTDFWHTHFQVVVSMQTLRADHKGRHDRLLEADPWDLVIVDESHHLNAHEKTGATLGHQLIKKMDEHGRIGSMLLFTGTPHRGHTYGFISQLSLLRPDLFDPQKPLDDQAGSIRDIVIRNNKYAVTDLKGERLFDPPVVDMVTYGYSDEEQLFYDTLTDFIMRGRAYASGLSDTDASAVMLVLITMQKLASSSVAAIRRALHGRLARIEEGRREQSKLQKLLDHYENLEDDEELSERIADLEERLVETSAQVVLMADEEEAIRELLRFADQVSVETKMEEILELVRSRFQSRSVLFFTEYKATQSLLMSALIEKFGEDEVTFINGDDEARDVVLRDGRPHTLRQDRDEAESKFNMGRTRFLVSTEAAGEGKDLQASCHTLVHVDLPWNPMRLHQRVGRLLRYGQTRQVEVYSIRNPATVEARIWSILDQKLDRINSVFAGVMDQPEDLKELVLGVASPAIFRSLFADSVEWAGAKREKLAEWFDQRTATFGGEDAVDVVKALVGTARRFDFQAVTDRIPQVDLPDLRQFFEIALALHGRRATDSEGSISFITPREWRTHPAVRSRYEGMVFDREAAAGATAGELLGFGHRVFEEALKQAQARDAFAASVPADALSDPLAVYKVRDRVTGKGGGDAMLVGVSIGENPTPVVDWRLLKLLNDIPWRKEGLRDPSQAISLATVKPELEKAKAVVEELAASDSGFRLPECELLVSLWPKG